MLHTETSNFRAVDYYPWRIIEPKYLSFNLDIGGFGHIDHKCNSCCGDFIFVANSNLSCERVDIPSIANYCAVCVYHFRLICVTATILCRYAAAGGNLHRL